MLKYRFHRDAGHGWLQVRRTELKAMGIEYKITSYSYQYLDWVYLEEDLDAGTFLETLKTQKKQFEIIEVNDGDFSRIRNFNSFVTA